MEKDIGDVAEAMAGMELDAPKDQDDMAMQIYMDDGDDERFWENRCVWGLHWDDET